MSSSQQNGSAMSSSYATSLASIESDASLLNGRFSAVESSAASSPSDEGFQDVAEGPTYTLPALAPPSAVDNASMLNLEITNHHHMTWARTFHSRPEKYFQPESTEQVQELVCLARRKRKRIATVGYGHSPSDLTCTSSWMVNLDRLDRVLKLRSYDVDTDTAGNPTPIRRVNRVLVEAGKRLGDLNAELAKNGLTMHNIGSIDVQSIAGAIATATHGTSLKHGLLSECIRGLRIVLADGSAVWCSKDERVDLFRAALVSLGGLGIITEVEMDVAPATNLEWEFEQISYGDLVERWEKDIWTQAEFVRYWWLPYSDRVIIFRADKTTKPRRKPKSKWWYPPALAFHVHRNLMWLAHYFPSILPACERIIFGLQFGFSKGISASGVDDQHNSLVMDCLYSQGVNEWAVPMDRGLETLDRLSKWLRGDDRGSKIPFSSESLHIHSPIELRIADGSRSPDGNPRALLDTTLEDQPTLYVTTTFYRPFGLDPPHMKRFTEAWDWLMKEAGGRPHWAKNFAGVTQADFRAMYGKNMDEWLRVRDEVDPQGMFTGAWHRRLLLGTDVPRLELEEKEADRRARWSGGMEWKGEQVVNSVGFADESFEILEKS